METPNETNFKNFLPNFSKEEEAIYLEVYPVTKHNKDEGMTNVHVNGNNGTYKNNVNNGLKQYKKEVIELLTLCNARTPPIELAVFLEIIFDDPRTKEQHWLFISQKYNPRAINRTLKAMIKQHQRRDLSIKNPAAYFTHNIQYRKKRRKFISTNGTRKQQVRTKHINKNKDEH